MFEITCIFCHFSTIRFPLETLGIPGFLTRSCIYTVTFTEIKTLRTLKPLVAATKKFSNFHKISKIPL